MGSIYDPNELIVHTTNKRRASCLPNRILCIGIDAWHRWWARLWLNRTLLFYYYRWVRVIRWWWCVCVCIRRFWFGLLWFDRFVMLCIYIAMRARCAVYSNEKISMHTARFRVACVCPCRWCASAWVLKWMLNVHMVWCDVDFVCDCVDGTKNTQWHNSHWK